MTHAAPELQGSRLAHQALPGDAYGAPYGLPPDMMPTLRGVSEATAITAAGVSELNAQTGHLLDQAWEANSIGLRQQTQLGLIGHGLDRLRMQLGPAGAYYTAELAAREKAEKAQRVHQAAAAMSLTGIDRGDWSRAVYGAYDVANWGRPVWDDPDRPPLWTVIGDPARRQTTFYTPSGEMAYGGAPLKDMGARIPRVSVTAETPVLTGFDPTGGTQGIGAVRTTVGRRGIVTGAAQAHRRTMIGYTGSREEQGDNEVILRTDQGQRERLGLPSMRLGWAERFADLPLFHALRGRGNPLHRGLWRNTASNGGIRERMRFYPLMGPYSDRMARSMAPSRRERFVTWLGEKTNRLRTRLETETRPDLHEEIDELDRTLAAREDRRREQRRFARDLKDARSRVRDTEPDTPEREAAVAELDRIAEERRQRAETATWDRRMEEARQEARQQARRQARQDRRDVRRAERQQARSNRQATRQTRRTERREAARMRARGYSTRYH